VHHSEEVHLVSLRLLPLLRRIGQLDLYHQVDADLYHQLQTTLWLQPLGLPSWRTTLWKRDRLSQLSSFAKEILSGSASASRASPSDRRLPSSPCGCGHWTLSLAFTSWASFQHCFAVVSFLVRLKPRSLAPLSPFRRSSFESSCFLARLTGMGVSHAPQNPFD
jgi:hypothetical protein